MSSAKAADPLVNYRQLFTEQIPLADSGTTPGSMPISAGDGIGNALVSWTSATSGATAAAAFDGAAPTVGTIAVPGRGKRGDALDLAVTATDARSPFSVRWSFGDGASGDGASVRHAYAAAGAFAANAQLTDAAGNTVATVARTVTISDDGAGPSQAPPVAGAADTT